ncbi:MAG TPA: MOSC N-terminal beta barrel domain-containing protein [Actinomycetota bacterium]
MVPLGRVAEIWRFPVKSMRGERLQSTEVGENGLSGDRRFGVLDMERGSILSAKRAPELFLCAARYDDATDMAAIELPNGDVRPPGDDLDATLSEMLARPVRLVRSDELAAALIQMAATDTTTTGESTEWPAPPGTFFDASPIHFLTTSTLARYRTLYPAGDFDPRRFRANFVIDTPGDDGFVEEELIGGAVRIGDAVMHVTKACSRCVMTTLEQPGLVRDRGILRTIARSNDNKLGVRAVVTAGGVVEAGDVLVRA